MNPNTLRLRSPADVVCAIPYLVGFHPSDSVVVLACDGTAGACAVRLDLTAADELLEHVAGLIARRGPDGAILAGYGPPGRVTPMVERVRDRLHDQGVRVRDALRVEDGRFWSYLCTDTRCCPPEGTFVDVTASPVAAAAIAGGLVALPDRGELERMLAPVGRPATRAATVRAEQRLKGWAEFERDAERVAARMAREGVPLVRDVIDRACADGRMPGDEETAWLGLLLAGTRVRDEAWVRMTEPHLQTHMMLWRHVLTRVAEPYAAAPASLLSFAAWRAGEGALANIALDRALSADPAYSMALLLRELFLSGLPPSSVPLNLTPDDLDDPT
ncbi:hypothetical protein GCM10023191_058760 [Actinoallomurus oryzae]|uniref:DUF4192 domain-containing protein n=1 Tax=Actinoallomurus oryzae TaxID=502180 RepID=A0ABP8QJD9_9ACTN